MRKKTRNYESCEKLLSFSLAFVVSFEDVFCFTVKYNKRVFLNISEFGYILDKPTISGRLYVYGMLTGNVIKTVEVLAPGAKSHCAMHCIKNQCTGYKIMELFELFTNEQILQIVLVYIYLCLKC